MRGLFVSCILFFFMTSLLYAEPQKPIMGKINFPIAIKKEAQPIFIEGVLYLHNFDYDKARESFQKAQQLDQNAVMPYWGEAMTYNHPLWDEVDIKAGKEILNKLGTTPEQQLAKAQNDKEKGYLRSIQALYGEGDKATRDQNYLARLYDLFRQHPEDNEIASFYALALLGSTEGQRDFTTYMQAASIAEEVVRKNSEHPGGMHYAIHSFDDPVHAPLGLFYARSYGKIAADAPHALHMPSHIYLALGLWDDVIVSNNKAWQAGLNNNKGQIPADYTVHDFHALQWLSYGYLQKRDFKKAFDCVKKMEQIVLANESAMAKWYYAMMRAAYLVESGDWQADLKSIAMKNVELNGYANNVYVDSMIQLHHDNSKNTISTVVNQLAELSRKLPDKLSAHCGSSDYFSSITAQGITVGKIIILELQAQMAMHNKDSKKAIKLLQQAATLEEKTAFGYGPPTPVKPAAELLADVYLANNDFNQATNWYRQSLKRAPNRTLSVIGLKNAMAKASLSTEKNITVPYFNPLMDEKS